MLLNRISIVPPRTLAIIHVFIFVFIFQAAIYGQSGSDIRYVYDELGRLIAVIHPAGDTATYSYDEVGNLLSISRYSSAVVSIVDFTPKTGSTGTVVTIYGTGFSTTPGQNTVSFNGTTATVTSSTATQIVTSVPTGATTGSISLTTPSGNTTSAVPFVVSASSSPTITSFTPAVGPVGTAVTITGTNFETTAQNNKTQFNQTLASITSATTTSIATNVPTQTASGRISVGTPAGTATSANDFFITPSPYTAADVEVTDRMAVGDIKTIAITISNKIAIVVFDGIAGQPISVGMSSVTIGAPAGGDTSGLTIYRPDGKAMLNFSFGPSGNGTPSQVLPLTGTYSMVIAPFPTKTGSVTLTLSQDIVTPIVIGGSQVNQTISRTGQNLRLPFTGNAGQRISVGMTGVTIGTSSVSSTEISVIKSDGTTLLSPFGFGTSGGGTPSVILPANGSYALLVHPFNGKTGNISLTLSQDLSPAISIGGSAVNLTFVAGQNAFLSFSGTAGQRVSLGMTGVTVGTSGNNSAGISIYKPDGTTLLAPFSFGTSGGGTPSVILPVTGTYSIFVDPFGSSSGNTTLTLSEDLSPSITIGGSAVNLTFVAGQNAFLSFSGTAGQRVSLGMTGVTVGTSGSNSAGISIYKPDGTTLLAPFSFGTNGGGTPSVILPVTGTYSIYVDPFLGSSGNTTLTLSEDLSPSISIGGSSVNLTFAAGQNSFLSFSGTAGQRVSLGMSSVTVGTSGSNSATVAIYKPDGTTLLSPFSFGTSGGGTASVVLPVTGTYSIIVDPNNGASGNVTLTLSEDLTSTISIGGSSVTTSISRPGQNARLTFSGTASQQVTVRMTSNTIGWITVRLLKPDGSQLGSVNHNGSSFNMTSQTLPVSGTYTIEVDPTNANTGSITITVTSP